MEKEVLIALKGLQFALDEEGANALETITPAEYYKRNDSHYVIFEELMEGFTDTTKNVIKFRDSQLEVTKKGLVNVHMVFEENRKNMTSYATPFGNILIGIDTDEVEIREEEDRIQVNVAYTLEANYEHMADCKIEMSIRPREEGLEL
ncbi:MAG: DUF1934 domain-containing protein [Lachnospiraceae bacterium]|jgi:Uncharacterized protein conserved in bacteria|nr:DUF1934 domain-containing protein [Lachnospiraceae bacterium]